MIRKKRFYCSIPYLYRSNLLFACVLTPIIALLVLYIENDLGSFLTTVIQTLFIMIFISWPESILMSWQNRVEATSDGIYANTKYWGRRYMTWAEMEVVKPIRSFGMPYLLVSSFRPGKSPLLIPLYLTNPTGFQVAVSECASPINPLRRSLENGNIAVERAMLPA